MLARSKKIQGIDFGTRDLTPPGRSAYISSVSFAQFDRLAASRRNASSIGISRGLPRMSDHHPEQHGDTKLHFTAAEWEQFRGSDLAACKAVVLLMTGIFTIGLILYATIDYLIW
jgi:hypothetical protein